MPGVLAEIQENSPFVTVRMVKPACIRLSKLLKKKNVWRGAAVNAVKISHFVTAVIQSIKSKFYGAPTAFKSMEGI